MNVGLNAITHADQALAAVRTNLKDVDFWMRHPPGLLNRGSWKSGVDCSIFFAVRESSRAMRTLDASGIAPNAVADVRRALDHLGDVPLRVRPIRRALERTTSSLDAVRVAGREPFEAARSTRADLIASARSIITDEIAGAPHPDSRARLAEALRFDGQLDDAGSVLAHDELLASLPIDARRALSLDLISRPAADLTQPELRLLLQLVDTNASGGVIDMHGPGGSPHLADWMHRAIGHVLDGHPDGDLRHVERHFAAHRTANQELATRAVEADALFARDPRSLDQREWATLEAILAQDAADHLGFVTHLAPLLPLRKMVIDAQFGTPDARVLEQYFGANATRSWDATTRLRETELRVADAVRAYSEGTTDALRLGVRNTERDLLAQHVRSLPIGDQAKFAHALLRDADGGDLRILPIGLEITRRELLARRLPDSLQALRDETIKLVDANRARLTGHTPVGMTRGYANHPEYAELGRIHSNVQLLGAFDARANVPADVTTLAW